MMAAINPEKLVIARPFGQRAQAIVSYRDQHLIVGADSINSTMGERTRPADLILASLAADATFICQSEAEMMGISLYALTANVGWIEIGEGGFAAPTPTAGIPIPAALKLDDPEATRPMPRVLLRSTLGAAVRLTLAFAGPTREQSARLVEAIKVQSSVYRLLTCATTVEIGIEGE